MNTAQTHVKTTLEGTKAVREAEFLALLAQQGESINWSQLRALSAELAALNEAIALLAAQ